MFILLYAYFICSNSMSSMLLLSFVLIVNTDLQIVEKYKNIIDKIVPLASLECTSLSDIIFILLECYFKKNIDRLLRDQIKGQSTN